MELKQSVSSYRSQEFLTGLTRKAGRLWIFVLSVVALWAILILSAPIAAAAEFDGIAGPVYWFFGYVCHQIPERSFHIFGHQLAVCSRCTGVYFGLIAGLVGYPLFRPLAESEPLPRFWLFLGMIPIAVDWSLGYFGIWHNNHLSRVTTGLILGIACAVFIVPAIAELAEIRLTRTLEQN